MKTLSLFVPGYLPPAYVGATPTPYQSGTVDKFERQLVGLSPVVIRAGQATRLRADPAGRFAHNQIVTRYDLSADPEMEMVGGAILLALNTFTLDRILVSYGDSEMVEMTADDAEALSAGIHPWNEAA